MQEVVLRCYAPEPQRCWSRKAEGPCLLLHALDNDLPMSFVSPGNRCWMRGMKELCPPSRPRSTLSAPGREPNCARKVAVLQEKKAFNSNICIQFMRARRIVGVVVEEEWRVVCSGDARTEALYGPPHSRAQSNATSDVGGQSQFHARGSPTTHKNKNSRMLRTRSRALECQCEGQKDVMPPIDAIRLELIYAPRSPCSYQQR